MVSDEWLEMHTVTSTDMDVERPSSTAAASFVVSHVSVAVGEVISDVLLGCATVTLLKLVPVELLCCSFRFVLLCRGLWCCCCTISFCVRRIRFLGGGG